MELTFKNADSNGQVNAGAVVWALGSLKPQESKVVQVTATCSQLTPAAVVLATATADPGLKAEDKATTKVLGLLDMHVSLATTDASLAESRQLVWLYTILAILAVSILSASFVRHMLHGPLTELMKGTEHIGAGDLRHTRKDSAV